MAQERIQIDKIYTLKNRRLSYENGRLVKILALEPENTTAHVERVDSGERFMVDYHHLDGPKPITLINKS